MLIAIAFIIIALQPKHPTTRSLPRGETPVPSTWRATASSEHRNSATIRGIAAVDISIDWEAVPLDFSAWSLTGVGGDARPASVALGARLWATCVEEVAGLLTAASQRSAGDPWPTDGPQL